MHIGCRLTRLVRVQNLFYLTNTLNMAAQMEPRLKQRVVVLPLGAGRSPSLFLTCWRRLRQWLRMHTAASAGLGSGRLDGELVGGLGERILDDHAG